MQPRGYPTPPGKGWPPAGSESCPPRVTGARKRRQRVPVPCNRAPKCNIIRKPGFSDTPRQNVMRRNGPGALFRRGLRAGRKHSRAAQEPGSACRPHEKPAGQSGCNRLTKVPSPGAAPRADSGVNQRCYVVNGCAKRTEAQPDGRAGSRSALIVPTKRANRTQREPVEGSGAPEHNTVVGQHPRMHRNPNEHVNETTTAG